MDEIITSFENGQRLCKRIRQEHYSDYFQYIVFLFAKDPELNRCTIKLLPIHRYRENVTDYLLVTDSVETGNLIAENVSVPCKTVFCTSQEAYDIGRYCTEISLKRREKERILINGTTGAEEYRYIPLIGTCGITTYDITAMSVFDFGYVPDDDEIESKKVYAPVRKLKGIDWRDVRIGYDIEELITLGVIDRKSRIVMFSDTLSTRKIIERLDGYDIEAVLDNDRKKSGHKVCDIEICHPEDYLAGEHRPEIRIIVPIRSYKVICEQLHALGYETGKQVFVTYTDDGSDVEAEEIKRDMCIGQKIYEDIRREYREDKLYMYTYPGSGDVYLIGMYLRDRLRHDRSSSCVMVVASEGSRRILDLFDLADVIKRVYVLDGREECDRLVRYVRGLGYKKANAGLFSNDYGVIRLERMCGVKGIDFNTLFQKVIFFSNTRHTFEDLKDESADELFGEYNLRPGRTVLLSPFANTTISLTEEIWEQMAEELIAAGYNVVTNVSGASEKPVRGTVGIKIPYSKLIDFLDKAGMFIGLRSGLCDLISGSKALKLILYPPGVIFHYSTYINYFSLAKMYYIKERLTEVVVEDEEKCLKYLLSCLH